MRPFSSFASRQGALPLRRVSALLVTVRGKILVAFVLMSAITACLGLVALRGIGTAGDLVVRTFDRSLMSINYARAAAADFAQMQAALARREGAREPPVQQGLDRQTNALAGALTEDLGIAGQRAQSARAIAVGHEAERMVHSWQDARLRLLAGTPADLSWRQLDATADAVGREIDLLINLTAGDGFLYRERALATVRAQRRLTAAGTLAALLLAALVAWLLTRRIVGPLAAASAAAGRIAGGDLDGAIPVGSPDELGALLGAMTTMRDNIRAKVAREVEQRRSAQARLLDAVEGSREGIMLVQRDGHVAVANSQAWAFLANGDAVPRPDASFAELTQAALASGLFANGTPAERALLNDGLIGTLPSVTEARLGDGRWLRISRSATSDGGFVVLYSDITTMKAHEAELERSNLWLDAALSNMSQGLCLFDADNRLVVVNRRFCEIYRVPSEQVHPGISLHRLLELGAASGNHGARDTDELYRERLGVIARRQAGTVFQELADGRVVAIAHEPTAEGGWVATYEDITDRRRAEAQIIFMARHDALTSLPNRVLLGERLDQAALGLDRGASFAVLYLDLDQFKAVNDTLGHRIGDLLLRVVAERLAACARESDVVARLGGDEFAVLQHGLERPEDAAVLARRVVAVLGQPYEVEGNRLVIGASIGVAVAPGDGVDAEALLKHADMALYRAKAEGGATYRFFEPEMDARLQARRALELDLRQALADEQFELYYQPLIDLRRNAVAGFEALVRWQHPERGMISPADFVPLAEEIGLIVPLGEWVLRRACREAAAWPGQVKVAVNVSPAQFRSMRLVPHVIDSEWILRIGGPATHCRSRSWARERLP